MNKENLFDFIDSKAISEHLKSINYELKADEAALFVFQSGGKLFEEKHEAYNWIIENMPDVVLPERTINYKDSITLHRALKRYMQIENRLLENAMKGEENAIYTYEYFYNKDDKYYYGDNICKTFKDCKAIADEDEYNILRIKKQWLLPSAEYPPYIEVSLLPDGRVVYIYKHNMLSGYDELIYRFLGDVLWFDTPTPFKKGDILTYNNKIPHIHYHGDGLMVFEKLSYRNISEEKIQDLKDYAWSVDDMAASGYFINENGDVYSDSMHNFLKLDYYDSGLTGSNRTLKLLSDYMTDEYIWLDTVLNIYHTIRLEESAKQIRKMTMVDEWFKKK